MERSGLETVARFLAHSGHKRREGKKERARIFSSLMQKGSLLMKNLEGKFTKLTEFCKKTSGWLSAEILKKCVELDGKERDPVPFLA